MRMIDADSLESKLPAHSNDSNHVMTRNFAVESFRALIKAEPTVTPSPVYAKGILLDQAVRYAPAIRISESNYEPAPLN